MNQSSLSLNPILDKKMLPEITRTDWLSDVNGSRYQWLEYVSPEVRILVVHEILSSALDLIIVRSSRTDELRLFKLSDGNLGRRW